ncbi:HNH endonuclease signature motif containing protein [Nocardioides xinjiangensis]|uniref:HNH endonuclease signature motif containing protein n=1 Tax=Nocardioides xinjiangensis TaxID=2817376 RepID=UPI001B30AB4B|nr:HNH endonuclease signature motif containing protein [Nocardioides sp. SYSU D00778]
MSTTAAAAVDRPSSRAVLDRAVAAVEARRRADVEVVEAALAWAHAHVVPAGTDDDLVAGWRSDTVAGVAAVGSAAALFGERALPVAGAGTPRVAEFAVIELAAVLGVSHEAALALVGDVLDLAHRLPRLWALTRGLGVPVRLAREAARVSRDLDVVAAGYADRLLVWQPRRLNPHRIAVLVHEARLYADPDRAVADHDHALAARRVEVHHDDGAPGTSAVFMTLDTADAVAFDHTVTTMAATMRCLGHPGELGVRRAHAVGVLADPQKALDLLSVAAVAVRDIGPATGAAETGAPVTQTDGPPLSMDDPRVCVAEDVAYEPATPFRRPTTSTGSGDGDSEDSEGGEGGEVRLVVHVTDRDLLDHPGRGMGMAMGSRGVARCDRLGPMLLGRLRSWLLTAANVTVTPVLDLDPHTTTVPAVDRHDPPPRMAEAVRLRDDTCVYPHCGRPSQSCDLDHITVYVPLDDGGPPGQTRPDNLAPLCRRHHRAKTFADFTYHRQPDGSYHWTLPSGRTVTTDPPHRRPQPPP